MGSPATHRERPRPTTLRTAHPVDGDGRDGAPGGQDRLHALEAEVEQLHAALVNRAVIEQAKGVLMVLTGCGEQPAFDLLTHISNHTHRKVREVAAEITGSAAGRGRLPADVAAILRDACPPGSAAG